MVLDGSGEPLARSLVRPPLQVLDVLDDMRVALQRAKVTRHMWCAPSVALLELESDLIEFGTRCQRGECSGPQAVSGLRVLGRRMNDVLGSRRPHPRLTRRMSRLSPAWSWSLDWPVLAFSALGCFAAGFAIVVCAI